MSNKKISISFALAAVIILFVAGCYKDTYVAPNPNQVIVITRTISFQSDILPLFSKNCALSGCHATGGHTPDLSAANAYNSLTSGNFINTSAPAQSEIMMWLTGKRATQMPPTGLDPVINATILAWITQGANSGN